MAFISQAPSVPPFFVLHRNDVAVTFLLDAGYFDEHPSLGMNPASWTSGDIQSMSPEFYSGVRLYGECFKNNGTRPPPRVIAAQFSLKEYDIPTARRLLQVHYRSWIKEYTSWAKTVYSSSSLSPSDSLCFGVTSMVADQQQNQQQQNYKLKSSFLRGGRSVKRQRATTSKGPTLFMLLVKLSDPKIITVEQRHAVRRIVTDYLNNDISQGKVFSYLGQVIGYQKLDTIVNSMTALSASSVTDSEQSGAVLQNDTALGAPPQKRAASGTANATSPSCSKSALPTAAEVPSCAPGLLAASELQRQRREKVHALRQVTKSFRWLPTALPSSSSSPHSLQPNNWGERVVTFDEKAFVLGGCKAVSSAASAHLSTFPNDEEKGENQSRATPKTSLQDFIHIADLWSLSGIESVNTTFLSNQPGLAKDVSLRPSSLVGHSVHFGSFASGPTIIVYGGRTLCSENDATAASVTLNSHVLGLDLVSKSWVVLDNHASAHRPAARHSHASALVPLMASEPHSGAYAEYLVIFGGVGCRANAPAQPPVEARDIQQSSSGPSNKDARGSGERIAQNALEVLGDLWVFSFLTGHWTLVVTEQPPAPRFGASFFWASSSALVLFGGEGRPSSASDVLEELEQKNRVVASRFGAPPNRPVLYSDSWVLTYSSPPTAEKGEASVSPSDLFSWRKAEARGTVVPRAHYAAVAATACFPPSPSTERPEKTDCVSKHTLNKANVFWSSYVEACLDDVRCAGWEMERVLFVISGTTINSDGLIHEMPSLLLGVISQSPSSCQTLERSFVIDWRILDIGSFGLTTSLEGAKFRARRGHAAAFFEAAPVPRREKRFREQLKCAALTTLKRRKVNHQNISENNDKTGAEETDGKQPMAESTPRATVAVSTTDTDERNVAVNASASQQDCFNRKPIATETAPCILVTRGVTSTGRCRDDFWVLQLSKVAPKIRNQSAICAIGQHFLPAISLLTAVRQLGSCARTSTNSDSSSDAEASGNRRFSLSGIEALRLQQRALRRRYYAGASHDLHVLQGLWCNPGRNFQPALFQHGLCVSSGFLWDLATMIRHPLAPFGYLLENALAPELRVSNISICLERWRNVDAITVTDDGAGLSQSKLHLLLKRFGRLSDHSSGAGKYGLGFKLAASRLAHNCLVLTKTASSYGVGLFSAMLNAMFCTSDFVCPTAVWSASTGALIPYPLEEAEFGQNLRLILSRSPLETFSALEEELQWFGSGTGTRIIFFGIRKDLPYPVLTKDGQFSYTTYESSTLFFAPSTDTACPTGKQATGGDVAPTVTKSTTSSSTPEEGRSPNTVAANRSRKEDASSTTFSIKKTALCCDSIKLPECFPQYSSAIDAPDYNLASYMFWFHLHCSPALFLNGVQLCPQDAATPKQKQPNESSKTITLWEYLHQALHYKMEVSNFRLHNDEEAACGLIGFLNNPANLNLEDNVATTDKQLCRPQRCCETGVLLYHNGRLVNRALLRMPTLPECLEPRETSGSPESGSHVFTQLSLTVVLNVPPNLVPNATKEAFACTSSAQAFYNNVEKLIDMYLKVHKNGEALRLLEQNIVKGVCN